MFLAWLRPENPLLARLEEQELPDVWRQAPVSVPGCCVGFFHCLILRLNEGPSCQEAEKNTMFTFYDTKGHLLPFSLRNAIPALHQP